MSTPEGNGSVFITGLYDQPILGCLRQATYELTGSTEPDVIDPANPAASIPVKATYVLTPRQFRSNDVTGGLEDWGLSSNLTLEMGDTVLKKPQNPADPQPVHALFQNGDDLRINTDSLTLPDSIEPVVVELNLMGGYPGAVQAILDFKTPIRLDHFTQVDLLVSRPGSNKIVHIDHIKRVSPGCGVEPKLSFSPSNEYFEPVYSESGQMDHRAVVPASGGKFYVNEALTNNGHDSRAVGYWSQLTLPNGQVMPLRGPKTVVLNPESSYEKTDQSVSIDKRWPDGVYVYKLIAVARDSLTPEEATTVFRKGAMDQFVPPIH